MADFEHLFIAVKDRRDPRPYTHAVRVLRVKRGSYEQQHRFTFHPDNKLRFDMPTADGEKHTRYHFPDEAIARKFADRFGGEYLGEIARGES
ncbi:hypothetical protein [Bradyrhizobium sp. LeoA1S1]